MVGDPTGISPFTATGASGLVFAGDVCLGCSLGSGRSEDVCGIATALLGGTTAAEGAAGAGVVTTGAGPGGST